MSNAAVTGIYFVEIYWDFLINLTQIHNEVRALIVRVRAWRVRVRVMGSRGKIV
jgi:hypothetical protein